MEMCSLVYSGRWTAPVLMGDWEAKKLQQVTHQEVLEVVQNCHHFHEHTHCSIMLGGRGSKTAVRLFKNIV